MVEKKDLPGNEDLKQTGKSDFLILPRWLIKLCTPSRMLWLGPLLGVILSVPSIFSGYKLDDHIFRQQAIEKSIYYHRAVWDYFKWVSSDTEAAQYRERGIYVDWYTPDGFRWNFFRPVTSLVHAFEFRFFDNSPWIMHVILVLLYALLIFLCAMLLLRFSSSPVAVGIGILIFAIDDTHTYSSGWIAQYNTMLCCVFGLFAILMHDRWRRTKSIGGLVLSLAAFLLALLSSEGGMACMGYLAAYALFIESGSWRKKAATLIPSALIAAGYLVFYFMNHFGTRCFVAYLNPMDSPWLSAFAILSNTMLFTVSQILSLPPLTAILQFSGYAGVAGALVLFIILVFVFRKFLVSNKIVAFFGTGMVLSIVPFTLGFISDRLLLWAGLGAAGLCGELFTVQSARAGKTQRIFAKTLLFNNTVISIVFFELMLLLHFSFENGAQALEKKVPSQNTVLFNVTSGFSLMYAPPLRYERGGEWPQHFYALYCGADTLTVKRTGERTILATPSRGWLATEYERTRRPRQLYYQQGETIEMQLLTATIEKVTADGRPLSVRFTFKKDLAEFAWMKWTKKEPEICDVPAIGEEMRLKAPLF